LYCGIARDGGEHSVGGQPGEIRLADAAGHHGDSDVAGWGAPRKQARGKQDAQRGALLALGHEHAKTVERVRDLVAAETQEERCNGWVFDRVERGERTFRERAEAELCERRCGQG
jgi:hypothetical protein